MNFDRLNFNLTVLCDPGPASEVPPHRKKIDSFAPNAGLDRHQHPTPDYHLPWRPAAIDAKKG